MTFEQWQATRKWADDLSKTEMDWPESIPGFFYQCGTIEATEGGASPAVYHVLIANTSELFSDLEAAERHLWQHFAKDEIDAATPETTEALTTEYVAWCDKHDMPQLSADELHHDLMSKRDALAEQIAYLATFIERWEEAQSREDNAARA